MLDSDERKILLECLGVKPRFQLVRVCGGTDEPTHYWWACPICGSVVDGEELKVDRCPNCKTLMDGSEV